MKKILFISILALLFSVAALVKVYYPCQNTEENEPAKVTVTAADVEAILNDKPEIIFNAMQRYQQKMQEQALAAANQIIKDNINDINNNPNSPFVGDENAEIVLVEFYDYGCGFCHRLFPELNKVIDNNQDIKVVFKPLAFVASYSDYAARASLAAAEQGKFVEMHNALFAIEAPVNEDKINETDKKIGLDMEKFKADVDSDKINNIMDANSELAGKIQVGGVPTLILNGNMLQTLDALVIQDNIDELKN